MYKYTYAFTVKARNRANCETTFYNVLFHIWSTHSRISFKVPEYDKLGRLHYHGILESDRQWMKLTNPRFSFHFQELRSKAARDGWEAYCFKDADRIAPECQCECLAIPTYPLWKPTPKWDKTIRILKLIVG